MKKTKSLRLSQLTKAELKKAEMNLSKGGSDLGCLCICISPTSSISPTNRNSAYL